MVTPPTEAEIASLSNVHDSSLNPTRSEPSVAQMLIDTFKICQHQWAIDFLFTSDMAPLTALTAPFNIHHAISSTFHCTSVEIDETCAPGASTNHAFDIKMAGDIVFVPAFSVSSITTGFGIQRNSTLARAQWGYPNGYPTQRELAHFRYARCDTTDVLLTVAEDPASDVLRIDSSRVLNTRQRQRHLLVVRRAMFLELLEKQRQTQTTIDLKLVAEACILLCNYACHESPCAMCGNPKNVPCSCTYRTKQPKHPLDFSVTLPNMSKHLGVYRGTSSVNFYHNGNVAFSKKMGTRISIQPGVEYDLIDQLSRWAISDKAKDISFSPVHDVMPKVVPFGGSLNTIEEESEVTNSTSAGELKAQSDTTNSQLSPFNMMFERQQTTKYTQPQPQQLTPAPQVQQSEQDFIPDIQISPANSEMLDLNHLDSIMNVSADSFSLDNTSNQQNNASSPRSQLQLPPHPAHSLQGEPPPLLSQPGQGQGQGQGQEQPTAVNSRLQMMLGGGDLSLSDNEDDLVLTQQIAQEAQTAYENENSQWEGERGEDVFEQTNKRARSNPSTGGSEDGGKHLDSVFSSIEQEDDESRDDSSNEDNDVNYDINNKVKDKLKEREQRAELRRQRNREAAQRSNLRRKLKNDTLKRDLKETHARAATLRAQELILREENIRLRKQLSMR